MGSQEIEKALSLSLEMVESGEATIEEALGSYPALRSDLDPLVSLAVELRALPRVTAPDSLRGHGRPVFASRPADEPAIGWWRKLRLPAYLSYGWASTAARAAVALAIALALGGGTLVASAGSLPEEPLYPLKLAMENVRLAIAPDSEARTQLEMHFAAQRLEEVEVAVEHGRPMVVEQGIALYEERIESALAGSTAEQEGQREQQLQEALKQNHETLQRILEEPDKIQNPQARAAIDAAAQRTLERSEGLKHSSKSKDSPGTNGEQAPGKAEPTPDAPGQQDSRVLPADVPSGAGGQEAMDNGAGVSQTPAGKDESKAAGSEKAKR